MFYEITHLTLALGAAKAVNDGIAAHQSSGNLLGVFHADIGQLNRCVVLRGFDSLDVLMKERERMLADANPFGAGDVIKEASFETYKPFPFLPPIRPGKFGAVYEIRTYRLKHGGVPPTIAAWEAAMPERAKFSKAEMAMYALDGVPRFTHFWPYDSTNARAKARADAVTAGIWPPKGGPAWLTGEMYSMIGIPAAISPLC